MDIVELKEVANVPYRKGQGMTVGNKQEYKFNTENVLVVYQN